MVDGDKNPGARQKQFFEAAGKRFVYRYLEYNVLHTIPHYRSIEEVVLNIFRCFIPRHENSSLTKKRKNGAEYSDIFNHPEFPKANQLRDVDVVLQAWCTEGHPSVMGAAFAQVKQKAQLSNLVARTVLGREVWIMEQDCKFLLDHHLIAVRQRDQENFFEFVSHQVSPLCYNWQRIIPTSQISVYFRPAVCGLLFVHWKAYF